MKSKNYSLPVAGALLVAAATTGSAQELRKDPQFLDSTNRITASFRFGLNIKGKFTGMGSGFTSGPAFAGGRTSPDGTPYNYDQGYVLDKLGGSPPEFPYTWNWGYDSSTLNGNAIVLTRTTLSSLPGQPQADNGNYVGGEIAYNHLLGIKEDWGHMRYGIEGAVNFMPVSFSSGMFNNVPLTVLSDTYAFEDLTTLPPAPYQGTFNGPGYLIDINPVTLGQASGSGQFLARQKFDANLWGFRLGPYIEWPMTKKFSLHVSGGLAVGLLDAKASWNETLTSGSLSASLRGGGSDFGVMWGGYIGADAVYQFNKHWSIEAGVQYQNIGTYNNNFGGRTAELDLSQSLFIHAGIGYSF